MGYFWEQEQAPPERKQRWEFIELGDFKCTSFFTYLAYAWLWFMGFVGVAVYAVDTFTAINLLVFDRWSSKVKPFIAFKYSKWIFAVCILISWALCIYEWLRALRVIRRGGVAASYMDPLAASLQSMRPKGWKRFLVFTELTKSKKGTDYVAFFVYFAFQSAVRVILAEGPRQVVNSLTLYAVMKAQLIDGGTSTSSSSNVGQFFNNIGVLLDQNIEQAAIYLSMLFTLVIFVFSAVCLMGAGVLYIFFLWHYIPQRDGRLRIYCRRKIDRRLEKIVEHKVQAAIEDENKQREKAEKKAQLKRQKTGELPPPRPPTITRQPTLPMMMDGAESKEDGKLPDMPLSRSDTKSTVSTLPLYESRPPTGHGLERQPTLPDMALGGDRPPMPSRINTNVSAWDNSSFESDAPLLSNAGYAGGDSAAETPASMYSRQNSNASSFGRRPVPGRTMTQSTQGTQRSFTPVSGRPPPGQRFPVRSNTGFGFDQEPPSEISPCTPLDPAARPMLPPVRANTADGFRPGPARQDSQASSFSRPVAATPGPGMERRPTFGSLQSQQSSFSRPVPPPKPTQGNGFNIPFAPAMEQPTPPANSYEMTSQRSYSPMSGAVQTPSSTGFVAFNPGMHRNSPAPVAYPGAMRSVTVGGQPGTEGNYFGQVRDVPSGIATSPNEMRAFSSYGSIIDDYGAPTPDEQRGSSRLSPASGPPRSHTAGPNGGGWQRQHF